ncbi:MAG TPA: peptide-methionine (S)-S-oxide reductase MsrA [Gemmatimonadaceae bacterium]
MATQEIATLGGGCFWCIDTIFRELKGVERVESGYAGGRMPNPTYRDVCSGMTGHAEVVQVTFDPSVLSFRDLLGVFFTVHDPTTPDRQGADVGTQYRSIVLYHSDEQRDTTKQVIEELSKNKVWDDPIVTQVVPFTTFYSAEKYHQEYYSQNPNQPYCQIVIAPKVAKFRKKYLDKLRK